MDARQGVQATISLALADMSFSHSWVANRYFCLSLEAVLALAILALAFTIPNAGSRSFAFAERILVQAARKPKRAILLVMLVALAGRAILLPVIPVPQPWMHDEFSYLLAGETYALGRITNKPSLMWPHFESVHILQQPTYMSMYPPGQGLFLAIGERLAGRPWIGVWISAIAMSGAICWMLQGWLPVPWALIGGLLVVVRWGFFSYWVNSYWGGAVPALGGALVAGSLPRLLRWHRVRDSIILGLGLALLANSRPYEGLIFSATAVLAFVSWTMKRHLWRRIAKPAIVTALGVVLSITAAGMLYYNWRITGTVLKLPYVADREQYGIAPLFLWSGLRPEPEYRSASLRRVYEAEVQLYKKGRSGAGIPEIFRKLKDFWTFFFGPLLTIPIAVLFCPRVIKDQRTRFFILILVAMLGALLAEVWFYPHYASPAMAVILVLILQGMRGLRNWRWKGKPSGLFLVRAIPAACLLMGLVPVTAAAFGFQLNYWPLQWYGGSPDIVQPTRLTAHLIENHRKALIFVRYGPDHDVGEEWVYNKPDINEAPIIWAREIDPESDAALIRAMPNRSVWLFEPDKHPWKLRPYAPKSKPKRPVSGLSQ
jgi:hypothetical protein